MNERRSLFVTFAAALVVGCSDSTPPADAPPQPPPATGAPAPIKSAAEPPPSQTPAPPAPPMRPARELFLGKYTQVLYGDVKDVVESRVPPRPSSAEPLRRAMIAFEASAITLENTGERITWVSGGKTRHELTYEITGNPDDPIKLTKDGQKVIEDPKEVIITFKDDHTFEVLDPFAKRNPLRLVFQK